MPRYVTNRIDNFAPTQNMVFNLASMPQTANVITRLNDGAIVLDAVPLLAEMGMLYYAYEIDTEQLLGLALRWDVDYDDPDSDIDTATEIAWNAPLTGFLTLAAAENMADQFEGLPLTDGHVWVEPGKRDETAVGTFLTDAVIENNEVRTRALVYVASAIVHIDANGSELSIGGDGFLEANVKRGVSGEPDFFIQRVNLNHVALVERGRAGPQARLLNQKAKLANQPKDPKKKVSTDMVTIIINGVSYEVTEAVAAEFARLNASETSAATSSADLQNQIATLTTERDTAQGALTAAQAELATAQTEVQALQNNQPDVSAAAAQLALEHSTFVADATTLGHTEPLDLGAYDRTAVMRTVLNARGAAFADDANGDTLAGAWAFALAHAKAGGNSVIDVQAKTVNNTAAPSTISSGAQAAINNSYFGGKKKEA